MFMLIGRTFATLFFLPRDLAAKARSTLRSLIRNMTRVKSASTEAAAAIGVVSAAADKQAFSLPPAEDAFEGLSLDPLPLGGTFGM
jgi:hypothetical protein